MDGTQPAAPEPASPVDERARPPRRHVVLVGALVGILVIANNVGNVLATTLAEDHPAWLLALNSTNRILGLTTNQLDPASYYLIGSLRLLVADPLFFILGVWYGDTAIRWVERKWASQGQVLRMFEQGFSKAAYPVVFLAPNNIVCLLAGASGMPIAAFVAVNLAGTLTRLYLIRALGRAFASPIEQLLDLFAEYRIPLLILSVVLVGASMLMDRRRGRGDLAAVKDLEQELGTPADGDGDHD
jgi:membrane protein DedA with SNARE-associated domain